MTRSILIKALLVGFIASVFSSCSGMSLTAQEIIARSLSAQGEERLTNWKTITIEGTVDLIDYYTFTASYLLLAEAPDKLRVEQDMTVDKGRTLYEYFLNNGVAWMRQNLIPREGDLQQINRWLHQCYGVAWYAKHAQSLTRKEDSSVEWREREKKESSDYKVVATRPVYVVAAEIGDETIDLSIDKETFYLLQEETATWKRVNWDYRDFEGAFYPTKVNEIVTDSRGEHITPYIYQSVQYDAPIAAWLFTEDMPAAATSKQ